MAQARHRYVKVAIFEQDGPKINLMGGTVVGQHDDYLLIERPQPKTRIKTKAPALKKAKVAKANAQPSTQSELALEV